MSRYLATTASQSAGGRRLRALLNTLQTWATKLEQLSNHRLPFQGGRRHRPKEQSFRVQSVSGLPRAKDAKTEHIHPSSSLMFTLGGTFFQVRSVASYQLVSALGGVFLWRFD